MQHDGQNAFADALLSPEAGVPSGVVDPAGRIAPKRFAVYRNNVTVSLIEALASTFPRVQALVGENFFREMARQFARQHPPVSPVLMEYGAQFPDFVANFEPARRVPFLADIARLDRAWLDAFHAADALILDASKFARVGEEQLGSATFTPQPAMRVVQSSFPLVTIWEACRTGQPPKLAGEAKPEWALVVRPAFEVNVLPMDVIEGRFFRVLSEGVALGAAADPAMAENEHFDFADTLGRVMRSGAFSDVIFE